jgi:DNA modification methylase
VGDAGVTVRILIGDVLERLRGLPDESVHCVVTSPPYWGLRDYGTATWEGGDPDCAHRSPTMREGRNEDRDVLKGSAATNSGQLLNMAKQGVCGKCGAIRKDRQLGLEPTLGEHIAVMVGVFREVRRVLRKDGTLWLNYGDCYATSPNGRSAAATKAAGNDDRTFRDKPFSTIGGYLKAKDLCMVPNRLAIALQEDGWWVRSEIIWHKPNPMPESTKDRPGCAHEKIWLMSKSRKYYYDHKAVREPMAAASVARLSQDVESQAGSSRQPGKTNGPMKAVGRLEPRGRDTYGRHTLDGAVPEGERRKRGVPPRHAQHASSDRQSLDNVPRGTRGLRNVWTIAPKGFKDAHFATFPPALIVPCIKAGCPAGGTVLDPFGGSGTTGLVAQDLGRNAILIELNPDYAEMARRRIAAPLEDMLS